MKKIWDGFLFGIGASLAFHVMGFLLTVGMYFVFMLINMITLGSIGA